MLKYFSFLFIGLLALLVVAFFLGAGQFVSFKSGSVEAITPELIYRLAGDEHIPGQVTAHFRSSSPFARHQNYIIFQLELGQKELLRMGELKVASDFTTDLDHHYSVFANTHGPVDRWRGYMDKQYLVLRVPTRYVAYLDYWLDLVSPAESAKRRLGTAYRLQSIKEPGGE